MLESNGLSEREIEILRLVATGASNKEIAKELYISANTVKVHLRNIFTKIGATSRTEAAMFAVSNGFVDGMAPSDPADSGFENAAELELEKKQAELTELRQRFGTQMRIILLAAVLLVLVVVGVAILARGSSMQAAATEELPAVTSRWKTLAPMPTARYGLAAVVYESQIYAIAGNTDDGVTSVVERYDPDSESWDVLAEKPTPVGDIQAAVIGGKIYVPGGRLSSGEMTDVLEIYDPREDQWMTGPSLPIPVSAYALAAFEGKLYLFGGWDGKVYFNQSFEFNPETEAWSELPPMPTRRAYAGALSSNGKLFVIGGYNGMKPLSMIEAYQPDLIDNQDSPWAKIQSLPEGRYAMGFTMLADVFYIYGGVGEDNASPLPVEFSPISKNLNVIEADANDIRQKWSHFQMLSLEKDLFAIGGLLDGLPTSQNLGYQAIYTINLPIVR